MFFPLSFRLQITCGLTTLTKISVQCKKKPQVDRSGKYFNRWAMYSLTSAVFSLKGDHQAHLYSWRTSLCCHYKLCHQIQLNCQLPVLTWVCKQLIYYDVRTENQPFQCQVYLELLSRTSITTSAISQIISYCILMRNVQPEPFMWAANSRVHTFLRI